MDFEKVPSFLEQVIEQPVGSDESVELLPFTHDTKAKFFIERTLELDFNFIEGQTRCGTEHNNHVSVKIRVASNVRDSQGYIFDNAHLSGLQTALNGARISTSCEDLAIFVTNYVHSKSAVPLKWISVAIGSDFKGDIGFTWRENDEIPRTTLKKTIDEQTKAKAYEIKRIQEFETYSSPLFRGCGSR